MYRESALARTLVIWKDDQPATYVYRGAMKAEQLRMLLGEGSPQFGRHAECGTGGGFLFDRI